MKAVYAAGVAVGVCAVAFGLFFSLRDVPASPDVKPAGNTVPVPASGLIAHEWGTFTSFSGADGIPVGFTPDNVDLPSFVYHQVAPFSKGGYLRLAGKVSMETPVLYFYASQDMRVAVNVNFPRGWLTEWYPVATVEPGRKAVNRSAGQSLRWDVKVLASESPRLPRDDAKNHYYAARETDSAMVQVEDPRVGAANGGTVIQREKFLFYRGVGTFAPPVTVQSLGGGKVAVHNSAAAPVGGLVLLAVRGGKVAFKPLGEIAAKGELTATMADKFADSADLATLLVKQLTAAGLYEKEARAMVKTWDSAWFGEDGQRLLYLVPRALTEEQLPLTMNPKPAELIRVLVGRHDFVTPEQEADAERQIRRQRAAQAEMDAAETELRQIGRFTNDARRLATERIDKKTSKP